MAAAAAERSNDNPNVRAIPVTVDGERLIALAMSLRVLPCAVQLAHAIVDGDGDQVAGQRDHLALPLAF